MITLAWKRLAAAHWVLEDGAGKVWAGVHGRTGAPPYKVIARSPGGHFLTFRVEAWRGRRLAEAFLCRGYGERFVFIETPRCNVEVAA